MLETRSQVDRSRDFYRVGLTRGFHLGWNFGALVAGLVDPSRASSSEGSVVVSAAQSQAADEPSRIALAEQMARQFFGNDLVGLTRFTDPDDPAPGRYSRIQVKASSREDFLAKRGAFFDLLARLKYRHGISVVRGD